MSGIIAAFAGGAVAAANAPDQSNAGRVGHALAAWAVAVVVVVGASTLTAGSAANVATNLAGPSSEAAARIAAISHGRETTGQARRTMTQAQVEEARRHFAYTMLASFFALLLGAGAANAAGVSVDARTARRATDAFT